MGEKSSSTTTEKVQRVPSPFIILVRPIGADEGWTQLPSPVNALTQVDAKKAAARNLLNDPEYAEIIQGSGLELAAVTVRSFKPAVVKVEPQPAKVTIS